MVWTIISSKEIYCQEAIPKSRSNIVEFFYNDSYLMQGSVNSLNDLGFGLDYIHFFGKKKWGLEISSRFWVGRLPITDTINLLPSGEKIETQTYYFSGTFLWPIVKKNRTRFYGIGDMTFRGGGEEIVIWHHITSGGWPELIGAWQPQRDLGISVGSRLSFFPIDKIAISADLRYTRFLYRYYRGNSTYEFDTGTTKNLLTLQLKAGFCF